MRRGYTINGDEFVGGYDSYPSGGFGRTYSQAPPPRSQDNKYYELLGVDRNATAAEIKKSYLLAAKTHHPDKGGNADKFNEVQQAYEVLSDPDRRRIYDTYGEKGPQSGGLGDVSGTGGVSSVDLINMMFGGGRRTSSYTTTSSAPSRPKQTEKVKPVKMVIKVTLEDIFLGHVYKIPQKCQRCCMGCNGFGSSTESACHLCAGKGFVTKLTQISYGRYQQSQTPCNDCKGKGRKADLNNACTECQGLGTHMKDKTLQVVVEKGTPHEHLITLTGEGDETPGCLAGDVIMIVDVQPHQDFVRVGADLHMKKNITLLQALTGVKTTFVHLDGNITNIETAEGDIIGFGEKRIVPGLGLPFFGDNHHHGNLVIEFIIDMPKKNSLSSGQLLQLKHSLPGQENQRLMAGRTSTLMKDFNEADLNTNEAGGNAPTNKRSAGDETGTGSGCASQ